MQLGICTAPGETQQFADAGFDFVEHPAARIFPIDGDESAWAETAEIVRRGALPARTCNLFFPGDAVKLVGPDRDHDRAVAFADRLLGQLGTLDIGVQVFGSGGARRVPEGYSAETALEEMKELCTRLGPVAQKHGVVLAMEHLRAAECNLLTSVEETIAFVRAVDHPNVQLLADGYHMAQMQESYDVLADAGDILVHVHLADPETRANPAAGQSDLRPLFRGLKAAGYDGTMSLECGWGDMDAELRPSAERVRVQWAEA